MVGHWDYPLVVCALAADTNVGASTSEAGNAGSLMVIRQSVRGSSGSVSVAEWSRDALSQMTTSPTPYLNLKTYCACVAWRANSWRSATASSSGMPTMPYELPDTP